MKKTIIFSIILVLTIGSCTKSDIPYFDTTAGVDFVYTGGKVYKYSFYNTPDLKEYTHQISVTVVGAKADYDREVKVKVNPDSTTAATSDYQIIGGVIKANEVRGYVNVKFINNEVLKTKTARLWLELTESKDLTFGNIDNNYYELLWDNRLAEPANWKYYKFGDYSTTVHNFMKSVLGVTYIEYGYPDDPNVPNVNYATISAYQSKMRQALKTYNKEHPNAPLRHEDGIKVNELVIIP